MSLISRRLAVTAAVVTVFTWPFAAAADDFGRDNGETGGSSDGTGGISSGAGTPEDVRITFTPPARSSEGALTTSTWTPPACYYAPLRTPVEMETYWAEMMQRFSTPPWPPEDAQAMRDAHASFLEEFPDYNLDEEGNGAFWGVVRNDSYPIEERLACEPRTFWVDFSDPPPVEELAIQTDGLAELAWEQTRVPDTEVSLNPEGTQKVNLPTWVWLDSVQFEPVTVRAELDGYGIWAETTATPTELHLQPGSDARTFPASGRCALAGGSVGQPWSPGRSGEDPPCGVQYHRATHNTGPHQLQATLTWDVTWTDHAGNGGDLPEGSVATTVDITVEEVQTIVR